MILLVTFILKIPRLYIILNSTPPFSYNCRIIICEMFSRRIRIQIPRVCSTFPIFYHENIPLISLSLDLQFFFPVAFRFSWHFLLAIRLRDIYLDIPKITECISIFPLKRKCVIYCIVQRAILFALGPLLLMYRHKVLIYYYRSLIRPKYKNCQISVITDFRSDFAI